MLLGLRVAVRPADGLAVSMTVPLNPLIEEMVMVDVAVAIAFTDRVVGDAVMVKLGLTRCMLMTNVLWKVKVKKTKSLTPLVVMIGAGETAVPLIRT